MVTIGKKNASKDNFQSNGNGASGTNGGADYVTPSPAKVHFAAELS